MVNSFDVFLNLKWKKIFIMVQIVTTKWSTVEFCNVKPQISRSSLYLVTAPMDMHQSISFCNFTLDISNPWYLEIPTILNQISYIICPTDNFLTILPSISWKTKTREHTWISSMTLLNYKHQLLCFDSTLPSTLYPNGPICNFSCNGFLADWTCERGEKWDSQTLKWWLGLS